MAGQILITDTLASNRILLKARLAAARYQVSLAECPAETARQIAEAAPDLLIIGIVGTGAAELDLIRALKTAPRTAPVGILARAGGGDASLRRAALEAGADDVLSRQADPSLLLARIRSLMRACHRDADLAPRGAAPEVLGFAEPAPGFEPAGRIALIAGQVETATAWRTALAPHLRDRIEVLPAEHLLDEARAAPAPDVCVIEADLQARHDGLAVITDLRSRARTRTAGIVAVVAEGDGEGAVRALDLGADDVVEHPVDPLELVLRLRAQLRRKARADQLRRQLSDGLRLAVTDALTGLYNRRYALAQLGRIAEGAVTTGRPFAVMVLDLDLFKRVNDGYGHAAGDAVLIEVARRVGGALRAEDLVARLGGEEFLVAMPETGADAARSAAERLRRLIEEAPFAVPGADRPLRLTVSIGVAIGGATAIPGPSEGLVGVLVGAADSALYSAKAVGRNQVIMDQTAA